MKILNFLKKNLVAAILIVVIIVLAVLYFTKPTSNQANNEGTSLKTEEPISQPAAAQPATPNQAAPAAQTATGVVNVLFCLQLDGRQNGHLPALMGQEAQNAYPNGIKDGYNWNLPANATGNEDVGVLPTKVVFAKEAYLKKWGMVSTVAIKCDQTQWAPVNLQKGEVNGQPAYTYQVK